MIPVHDGVATVDTFVRVEGSLQCSETVLLVPDPLTTSFMFRHVIPLLVARNLRVVCFDFPGTGHTHSAPPSSVQHGDAYYVEFVARVAESLQLRATHVVGHGVGARVALDYAIAYPKRVRSVAVVGAAPNGRAALLPETAPVQTSHLGMSVVISAYLATRGITRPFSDIDNYAFFLAYAGAFKLRFLMPLE